MARRSYKPEQIIKKLREAEVLLSQGSTTGEAARKMGVTNWHTESFCQLRRAYLPLTFLTYCLYFSVEEKKVKKKNGRNNFMSFTKK